MLPGTEFSAFLHDDFPLAVHLLDGLFLGIRNSEATVRQREHLARLGHTRIAHVAGPQEASTGMSRLRGFRDGMATHGLPVDEDLIAYATRYTVEEGARCCRELLARPGDFTAVAAANDMLAV